MREMFARIDREELSVADGRESSMKWVLAEGGLGDDRSVCV